MEIDFYKEILNYGILGLWTISLLVRDYSNEKKQKEYLDILRKLNLGIEKINEKINNKR